MGILDALRDKGFWQDVGSNAKDFAQGASNSAASNLNVPVDALAWLLRKGGVNVPNPVGGSDWMAQQGLTAEPKNKLSGLLGEAFGGVAPIVAAAKAPQIAGGLLRMGENAMSPNALNAQAGVIGSGITDAERAQRMADMGMERGWFRSGPKIGKSGQRNGPMYTQDRSEAMGYLDGFKKRTGTDGDMREYAIPATRFLNAERAYPNRLAHDVANVIDNDFHGAAGQSLAKELRTFSGEEKISGGELWQALESRFGNDGAAEVLSKLKQGNVPAFNGAKGMTRADEAYVFKHSPVRDAEQAKFNLADYGKDDIYGKATLPMIGLLGGTALGTNYLLRKD